MFLMKVRYDSDTLKQGGTSISSVTTVCNEGEIHTGVHNHIMQLYMMI